LTKGLAVSNGSALMEHLILLSRQKLLLMT